MDAIGSISTAGLSTPVVQPRLVQAAHEFEAQLMKELLKPLTAGTSLDGEESDMGSAAVLGELCLRSTGASAEPPRRTRHRNQYCSLPLPK